MLTTMHRQYKFAMKKQLSSKKVPPKSSSGSDEEEEFVEEEDVDQSIDGQSGSPFESKSSAAMYSHITEMSRQLAEMMEMHRKQQLMEKKKLQELHLHSNLELHLHSKLYPCCCRVRG